MAAQVEGHTPQFEEVAGLYALEALEASERAEFERHLAGCAGCQQMVAEDRATLGLLAAAAPEVRPSDGLKQQLLERAAAEIERTPVAARPVFTALPAARAPRVLPMPLFRTLALAAALVVALGVGVVLGQRMFAQGVLTATTLQGQLQQGNAVVTVHRSGAATLQLSGLPDPPADQVYQAWVIPPGGSPIPVGTSASGDQSIPLPASIVGRTVALTVEPAPGSPAPSSPPILTGEVSL